MSERTAKLVIPVGEQSVTLTIDEAKALYEQLRALFGANEVTIPFNPYPPSVDPGFYGPTWQEPHTFTCFHR